MTIIRQELISLIQYYCNVGVSCLVIKVVYISNRAPRAQHSSQKISYRKKLVVSCLKEYGTKENNAKSSLTYPYFACLITPAVIYDQGMVYQLILKEETKSG